MSITISKKASDINVQHIVCIQILLPTCLPVCSDDLYLNNFCSAFNNVWSNIGYVLLGIIFIILITIRFALYHMIVTCLWDITIGSTNLEKQLRKTENAIVLVLGYNLYFPPDNVTHSTTGPWASTVLWSILCHG